MIGQDGNVIFPEMGGMDEDKDIYAGTGQLMAYKGPGAKAHGTGVASMTPEEMDKAEERMMQQLKRFDIGCIFHDTPDGNGGNGQGRYPASALEAQMIPSAESPNGPPWSHYIQV